MCKCYICDNRLGPSEIEFEPDYGKWRPCNTCIDLSGERAFKTEEETFDFTEEELAATLEGLGIE